MSLHDSRQQRQRQQNYGALIYVLTGKGDGNEGDGDDGDAESSYEQGAGQQAQGEASRGLLAYRNAERPETLHK